MTEKINTEVDLKPENIDNRNLNSQLKIYKRLISRKELIEAYINSDKIVEKIVNIFKITGYYIHKNTFKKFMTSNEGINIDLLNDTQLIEAISSKRYQIITVKTLNIKLNEMKALGLIDFSKTSNYISSTDKLATYINKVESRVKKSIPDKSKLAFQTESKLMLYRIKSEDYILNEEAEKLSRYKNIHQSDVNKFIIERRQGETKQQLLKRIRSLIESSIIDKNCECIINNQGIATEEIYRPIKLLMHEEVDVSIEDIERELDTPRYNQALPFRNNKIELYKYKFTL